jgi:hypothetical protein
MAFTVPVRGREARARPPVNGKQVCDNPGAIFGHFLIILSSEFTCKLVSMISSPVSGQKWHRRLAFFLFCWLHPLESPLWRTGSRLVPHFR